MSFIDRPQATSIRKALFQVHLWTGIVLSAYAVVIGATGALLVFRPEIQARLYPQFFDARVPDAPLADPAVVIANLQRAYPGYHVSGIDFPSSRRNTFLAYPTRGEEFVAVFLDRTTGDIIGEMPKHVGMQWVQDLHFYLLGGATGLIVNGIAAACLTTMCMTGLLLWWPGVARWARAMVVDFRRGWRRATWELHGAVGFWAAALLLLWAVSGVYFAFPGQFRRAVAAVSPLTAAAPPSSSPATGSSAARPVSPSDLIAAAQRQLPGAEIARYIIPASERGAIGVTLARDRHGDADNSDEVTFYFDRHSGAPLGVREAPRQSAGDVIMAWLGPLHVGNFGGLPVKIVWALLALAFPTLAVTGVVMWWPTTGISLRRTPSVQAIDRT